MAIAVEPNALKHFEAEVQVSSPSPSPSSRSRSEFDDGQGLESEDIMPSSRSTPEEDVRSDGSLPNHHVDGAGSLKRKRSTSSEMAQTTSKQLPPSHTNGVGQQVAEQSLPARPDSGREEHSTVNHVFGSAHSASQPRKRLYSKRVKSGCITCRKRKKKCDEKHPECENCIKSGHICAGYTNRPGQSGGRLNAPKPLQSKTPLTDVVDRGPVTPVTSTSNGQGYPTNTSRTRAAELGPLPQHVAYVTDRVSNEPRHTRPAGGPLGQVHSWPPQQAPSSSYTTKQPSSAFNTRRTEDISHPSSNTRDMRPSASIPPPSTSLPPPPAMTQQSHPPPPPPRSYSSPNHISPPPPPANYYNATSYHNRAPSYTQPHPWSAMPADYSQTSPPVQPGKMATAGPPSTTSSHHSHHSSIYDPLPPPLSHTSAANLVPPPSNTSRAPSLTNLSTTSSSNPFPPPPPAPETAKSLMLRSASYDANDPDLVAERMRCADACARYNNCLSKPSHTTGTLHATLSRDYLAQIIDPAAYENARVRIPAPTGTSTASSAAPATTTTAAPTAAIAAATAATATTAATTTTSTTNSGNGTEKGLLSYGVQVEAGFSCSYGYNLRLHDSCFIDGGVQIDDSARVDIGARSVIGRHTLIETSRPLLERVNRKGAAGERVAKPVVVEAEAVVGSCCVISGGVRLGRGCTVVSGSVVKRDVRAGEIYDGAKDGVEELRAELRDLRRERAVERREMMDFIQAEVQRLAAVAVAAEGGRQRHADNVPGINEMDRRGRGGDAGGAHGYGGGGGGDASSSPPWSKSAMTAPAPAPASALAPGATPAPAPAPASTSTSASTVSASRRPGWPM